MPLTATPSETDREKYVTRDEIRKIVEEEIKSILGYEKYEKIDIVERIIRIEEEIKHLREDFKLLLHQIDKRFEQVNKRFEQVDKRFEDMQNYMDKRFEQIDKRFEDMQKYMDRRFSQLFTFMSLGFSLLAIIMTVFKFIK